MYYAPINPYAASYSSWTVMPPAVYPQAPWMSPAGPPAWAPAHGYRRRNGWNGGVTQHYRHVHHDHSYSGYGSSIVRNLRMLRYRAGSTLQGALLGAGLGWLAGRFIPGPFAGVGALVGAGLGAMIGASNSRGHGGWHRRRYIVDC